MRKVRVARLLANHLMLKANGLIVKARVLMLKDLRGIVPVIILMQKVINLRPMLNIHMLKVVYVRLVKVI
jgi:hypothetical protein